MMTNEKEPEEKEWAVRQGSFPERGRPRHACQHLRHGARQESPNKDNAVKLMEFLASDEAQTIYAEQVFEYPVGPNAKPSDIVAGFGRSSRPLPLTDIAANRKVASELVDKVGLNEGPTQ